MRGSACLLGLLALAAPAAAQQGGIAPPPAAALPPAMAAEAGQPGVQTQRSGWSVTCAETPATPPRQCALSALITLQPQNQRFAQVLLTRQPETRSLGLVFLLPHGAALGAGMSWQLDDGEAQRLAFQNSDVNGVYAGVAVTDDVLVALRAGTVLRISFLIAAQRRTLTMPIPLAQFAEGVAELFATENRPAPPAAAPPAPPAPTPPAPQRR